MSGFPSGGADAPLVFDESYLADIGECARCACPVCGDEAGRVRLGGALFMAAEFDRLIDELRRGVLRVQGRRPGRPWANMQIRRLEVVGSGDGVRVSDLFH
jgi:hypothetical protein